MKRIRIVKLTWFSRRLTMVVLQKWSLGQQKKGHGSGSVETLYDKTNVNFKFGIQSQDSRVDIETCVSEGWCLRYFV